MPRRPGHLAAGTGPEPDDPDGADRRDRAPADGPLGGEVSDEAALGAQRSSQLIGSSSAPFARAFHLRSIVRAGAALFRTARCGRGAVGGCARRPAHRARRGVPHAPTHSAVPNTATTDESVRIVVTALAYPIQRSAEAHPFSACSHGDRAVEVQRRSQLFALDGAEPLPQRSSNELDDLVAIGYESPLRCADSRGVDHGTHDPTGVADRGAKALQNERCVVRAARLRHRQEDHAAANVRSRMTFSIEQTGRPRQLATRDLSRGCR